MEIWQLIVCIIYVCGFVSTGIMCYNHRKPDSIIIWFGLVAFCFVWPFIWIKSFVLGWKEAGK
jgi:hypothetical protein